MKIACHVHFQGIERIYLKLCDNQRTPMGSEILTNISLLERETQRIFSLYRVEEF